MVGIFIWVIGKERRIVYEHTLFQQLGTIVERYILLDAHIIQMVCIHMITLLVCSFTFHINDGNFELKKLFYDQQFVYGLEVILVGFTRVG